MTRAALAAALAVATSAACAHAPDAPTPTVAPPEATATVAPAGATPTVAATGPFVLGLNEAVAVPRRAFFGGALSPDALAADLAADAALARALGARSVRGHTGGFPPLAFSDAGRPGVTEAADAWVRAVQAAELEPIGMVSPWPANHTDAHTRRYLPDDLDAYALHVRRVVERYDHDGVDDMPGLRAPVRAWEIDNEPDLKFVRSGRGGRAVETGLCAPAEYARVLIVSADAVHAADPDATVLMGGLYRPHADAGEAYLRAVLAVPGARERIDVLSLHTYADDDGERLAAGIARARALLPDRPVWVTETSAPSDPDPAEQARRVASLVAHAAAAGAVRLYWHTLADPPPDAPIPAVGARALLRTLPDGRREEKPAASVFRHLAARIAEDDAAGATPDGDGALGLKSGATLLWKGERISPNGGQDLVTGAILEPGAIARAPAWLK